MNDQGDRSLVSLDQRLTSLTQLLLQLYAAGGIPLAVIGLGAVNLFLPYQPEPRIVVTTLAIVVGAAVWVFSSVAALLRWRTEAQLVAQREAILLNTVIAIARDADPMEVKGRLNTLVESIRVLGIPLQPVVDDPSAASRVLPD